MAQPAQGNMLSTKQEKPLYTQEPFSKQLNRTKAVQGKLLEDITMTQCRDPRVWNNIIRQCYISILL